MKKILLSLAVVAFTAGTSYSQTLFSYGAKQVSKAEFLRAFEKNPDSGSRKSALEKYLPLYINYKLKVQDAYDKKLDTLPAQQDELENYRRQLRENFLLEKADVNVLVREALVRSQRDILLGDLFLPFDINDSASIRRAEMQATQAYSALQKGEDFGAVVNRYSQDADAKQQGGELGWITAFTLPYPYETAIYNLANGGYSRPVKGGTGYHIFKRISDRPAAGKSKVAQILLSVLDKNDTAAVAATQKQALQIAAMLKTGSSFDSLAQQYSNDRTSYHNGGQLPEFGVGTYAPAFENVAFSLKNKGDFSAPFQTEYGWHILKLLSKTPVPADSTDAEFMAELKQKVLNSGRITTARQEYIKSRFASMGFKQLLTNKKSLWQYCDSALKNKPATIAVKSSTPVFSFGTQKYTANDFTKYLQSSYLQSGMAPAKYESLLQNFINQSGEIYLLMHLDQEPAMAALIQDFKDANLLFESMDRNVWSKASADSVGLAAYYKQHKDRYQWGPSAKALMVTALDSAAMLAMRQTLQTHPEGWRTVAAKYPEQLIADSGRFELGQLSLNGNEHFSKGQLTPPSQNKADGSYSFAYIFSPMPDKEQRSFEEARGFVINDYQQVLEEKWLNQLKKKYPVKLNQAVWQQVLNGK